MMPDSSFAELSALLIAVGLQLQRFNNTLERSLAAPPSLPQSAELSLAHALVRLIEDRRGGRP